MDAAWTYTSVREPLFIAEAETDSVLKSLQAVNTAVGERSLAEFLKVDAANFFRDDIESRFNEDGDVKSGFWAPLSETTTRIREQLGFNGADPILRRTDNLFDFLMGEEGYPVTIASNTAMMEVPGTSSDPLTTRKLEVAAKGTNVNARFPGAVTPPRPPLAVSEADLGKLLELLMVHITNQITIGVGL